MRKSSKRVEHIIDSLSPDELNGKSSYYRFGYDTFGPLLFGFTRWLKKKAEEEKVEQLLFLARDGYMMKKAYTVITQEDDEKIPAFYVYCSRKSLRQALLWKCDGYQEIIRYVNESKFISLGYILELYGFSPEESRRIADEYSLDINYAVPYRKLDTDRIFSEIYYKYKSTIIERSRKQDELLLRYLEGFDVSERCGVVDIGWHGSMQYYLENFFANHGKKADIVGFYVGNYSFYQLKGKAHGFLFSSGDDPLRKKVLCSHGIMEKMLQSPEGSTVGYELKAGEVVPVNLPYEYQDDTRTISCIKEWQEAALKFVYNAEQLKNDETEDQEYALRFINFGIKPSLSDTKTLSFLYNYDGQKYYYPVQKPLLKYKPREFLQALNYSPWKTGFMRSAFKLPLPYYLLYYLVS